MTSTKRTREIKPTTGQLNFLGDVYDFRLTEQPHIEGKRGAFIVVTKIPADKNHDELYRKVAEEAAHALLRTISAPPKPYRRRRY